MKIKEEAAAAAAGSPHPLGASEESGSSPVAETRDQCEGTVPQIKLEPEEGDMHVWEGQWHDFLKSGEPSCSGWGNVPLLEVKSSPALLETPCKAEEEEEQQQEEEEEEEEKVPSSSPKAEEQEERSEEKEEILSDGHLDVEFQRQRFRNFLYKEAEGPRAAYLQLEELCYGWLEPERRTKEEIMELLILEQFLAVLPPEMESWVRERSPETCDWAVELAEDFLQWQQEEGWEGQDVGRVEELDSSFCKANQVLVDTGEKAAGRRIKRKRKRNSSFLGDDLPTSEDVKESQRTPSSEFEEDEEIYSRPGGLEGQLGEPMEEGVPDMQDEIYISADGTHQGAPRNVCPACGKSFTRLSHLKRHLVIHTGERPYKCSACGKGFTQKTNLAAHEVIHREGICSDCGKSFKLKWGLTPQRVGEMWYKCSDCRKLCSQEKGEAAAVVARPRPLDGGGGGLPSGEGGLLPLPPTENPPRVKEEGPSETRAVENEVEEWMCRSLKVPGGVLCKVKATPKSPGNYKGKKQSPCPVCGKVFATRSSLNRHQRIHTGEKPYICSICGKSFNQKTSLLTHSFIHTEQKPYQCSECGKSFRHSTGLLVHQRMHTGEKPYKCSICQKNFSQSSHVVKHISRKHAKEKEKLRAAHAAKS